MTPEPKPTSSIKCASWLGHRFEPRYHTKPASLSPMQIDQIFWLASSDRARLTAPARTYVYDICTRCGHVVKAPPHD